VGPFYGSCDPHVADIMLYKKLLDLSEMTGMGRNHITKLKPV